MASALVCHGLHVAVRSVVPSRGTWPRLVLLVAFVVRVVVSVVVEALRRVVPSTGLLRDLRQ